MTAVTDVDDVTWDLSHLLDGRGGPYARHAAAQVGVDEQHVEAAALGGRALQAAQRGRTAARGGDLDIGLGRQRGGQRLGEDAMVVDDQDSDANHETPFPKLSKSRGYPIVMRTTPGDEHGRGRDARSA